GTARLQKRQRAGGLHQFEAEQDVPLPLRNDRRKDLRAVPDMGDDTASPLGHAVDFAFLDVESGQHRRLRQYLRGEQDTLPSDAYQQYVCYLSAHFFTLPIASNLHN